MYCFQTPLRNARSAAELTARPCNLPRVPGPGHSEEEQASLQSPQPQDDKPLSALCCHLRRSTPHPDL
jgi:hypothetical protein